MQLCSCHRLSVRPPRRKRLERPHQRWTAVSSVTSSQAFRQPETTANLLQRAHRPMSLALDRRERLLRKESMRVMRVRGGGMLRTARFQAALLHDPPPHRVLSLTCSSLPTQHCVSRVVVSNLMARTCRVQTGLPQ
jgi:hypothetical protein